MDGQTGSSFSWASFGRTRTKTSTLTPPMALRAEFRAATLLSTCRATFDELAKGDDVVGDEASPLDEAALAAEAALRLAALGLLLRVFVVPEVGRARGLCTGAGVGWEVGEGVQHQKLGCVWARGVADCAPLPALHPRSCSYRLGETAAHSLSRAGAAAGRREQRGGGTGREHPSPMSLQNNEPRRPLPRDHALRARPGPAGRLPS